jgi:hypothetical protein
MNPYNPDSDSRRSWIKENPDLAWVTVHSAISRAGGPMFKRSNLKERLRSTFEFKAYVMPGSHDRERELIKLLRSMAKMVHCFRPFDGRHADHLSQT